MTAPVGSLRRVSSSHPGWVYRTLHWRRGDGDFEAWVRSMKADGWELWAPGPGTWSTIDGQRTFGVSVRKLFDCPLAAPPR